MLLKNCLLSFFSLLIASFTGQANVSYSSANLQAAPPVKKIKPATKKTNKRLKYKRLKNKIQRLKLKKKSSIFFHQETKYSPSLPIIIIVVLVLVSLAGFFLAIFGLGVLTFLIIGLSLTFLANLTFLIVYMIEHIDSAMELVAIVGFGLSLVQALFFLIHGVAIAFSIFWVAGIVLLLIGLLLAFFFIIQSIIDGQF